MTGGCGGSSRSVQADDYWGVVASEGRFRVVVRLGRDRFTIQQRGSSGWRPLADPGDLQALVAWARVLSPELAAACEALPGEARALRSALVPPDLSERSAESDAVRDAFAERAREREAKRTAALTAWRRRRNDELKAMPPEERARVLGQQRARRAERKAKENPKF